MIHLFSRQTVLIKHTHIPTFAILLTVCIVYAILYGHLSVFISDFELLPETYKRHDALTQDLQKILRIENEYLTQTMIFL